MKKVHLLLALAGVALIALIGCESTGGQSQDEPVILSADQLQILTPSGLVAKADDIDDDHEIYVRRYGRTRYQTPLLRMSVESRSVSEDVVLTAQWQGNNEEDPEYGYEFGPEGMVFDRPIVIAYALDLVDDIDDVDLDLLSMYYDREDGTYEQIYSYIYFEPIFNYDGGHHDLDFKIWVVGWVDHFSKYIIATGPPTGGGLR